VIFDRISRQRLACSSSSFTSSACGEYGSIARSSRAFELARDDRDRGERRAEFVRGGGGQAVELRQMLLAGEHELGRRQRVGQLARLLDDLPRIDADIPDREQDREPDPERVDLRQIEGIVDVPGQVEVEKHQQGGAQHGERAERQRHARRQRGRRNQHRAEQQIGERVLQTAGEIEQRRQLRDVEPQQPRRAIRLEPQGLGKGDAQRHVENGGQGDYRQARPHRHFEFQAVLHHQDGAELAEYGEPAQPHQRVEPHVAPMMVLRKAEHGAVYSAPRRGSNGDGRTCASSLPWGSKMVLYSGLRRANMRSRRARVFAMGDRHGL
jgi:hypothetical protein